MLGSASAASDPSMGCDMKSVRALADLAPVAVALAIYALIIWYVMPRDSVMGRLLIAIILVGHGLVHVLFGLPRAQQATAEASDATWPFDLSRSWLVSASHHEVAVRLVALVLSVLVVPGFTLAGLSTLGLVVPADCCQPLILVSAIASVGLLVIGFSPALALGFAIDAVFIWLVLVMGWTPHSSPFGM
jgi:hypothetical protein